MAAAKRAFENALAKQRGLASAAVDRVASDAVADSTPGKKMAAHEAGYVDTVGVAKKALEAALTKQHALIRAAVDKAAADDAVATAKADGSRGSR